MVLDNKLHSKTFYYSAIFIIVIAVILCYLNTINSPFVWDDEEIVQTNYLIKSWKNIPQMFSSTVFGEKLGGNGFYRPIQLLSYSLDYKIWKLNPAGYHLSNIFFHLLNALLVFFVLIKIGLKKKISFFVALLFAVHPLNTEAVTYISGRGDLLFLFFSLLCFLFFINGTKGKLGSYFGSAIFFMFAILSKESAIVIPFIILIYYLLFSRKENKRDAKFAVFSLIAMAFLYLIIRFETTGISGGATLSLINEASLWERILTLPRTLITYIGLLIFPHNLHMEYLFVEKTLASPYIYLGIPFLIALFYLVCKYIKPVKFSVFFLGWFLIGLGPFYNLIFPLASTLREHWVYLAEIGFLTLMGLALFQLLKLNRKYLTYLVILISLVLVSYYGYSTISRNKDWKDPFKLYKHDLKYEPQSFLLHNNLGVEYFRKNETDKAEQCFLNSIKVSPGSGYDVAHNNLGVILEQKGEIDHAISQYKKSIQLGQYKLAYGNLGRVYVSRGEIDQAISVLSQGLSLYPTSLEMNYYLGVSYFYKQKFQQSYNILFSIQKVYPGYKQTQNYLEKIKQISEEK